MKTRTNGKKPAPTPATTDGNLPPTLFRNSLRLWQARWKAQQTAPAASSETPHAAEEGETNAAE